MGLLLDIVPNHMSATSHNPWWDDMLANGPFSRYANFFDIRIEEGAPFRVNICSLARAYGAALAAGELQIKLVGKLPRVFHYENSWPLSPVSWLTLLGAEGGEGERLERLLQRGSASSGQDAEYAEYTSRAQQRLDAARGNDSLSAAIEGANADPALLHEILRRQFYELHNWRLAGELTNFRRFFDISTLSGLRTELPDVMQATHARISAMVEAGDIDGLRVDHPDGLREPHTYFQRLRALPAGRVYVEKILETDERLVEDWPIDGTVGYDFLARVNRLWMDDVRTDFLTATYQDFTGHTVNLGKLIRENKRAIIDSTFAVNMDELAQAALILARARRETQDISPRQLREALARIIVALPIYRTYRTARTIHADDLRIFLEALQVARGNAPDIDAAVFDFLSELFCRPELNGSESDFVAKWQQLAPAVMAKGVEDTAFYRFDRLISCNEVGSSASLIGISAGKFHEYCHYLSDRWPNNMLATSTHDNKRSEDVRTRISLLSEIPDRWASVLHQWSQMNAAAWQNRVPDRHAEYLLYQTLIGAWPLERDRCWQYMLKACREAKINTSWHEPNAGYEEKVKGFIDALYESREFTASLAEFVGPLIGPGRINSLAQTLIKMVAPGLPDFYQGTELWDLSLVDPDNRRPVDFAARERMLAQASDMDAAAALGDWDSGLPKLWMIQRILKLRAEHADVFSAQSGYQPLVAQGSHLSKLLAFRRGENLIAVVPRLALSLGGEWGDTRLPVPGGSWRNVFTGAIVHKDAAPGELFSGFPVALLHRVAE